MKKLISALLVIVLIISAVVGVYIFLYKWSEKHYGMPEGYTGGFEHHYGQDYTYYWVETYDECVAAIEKLESHGSNINNSLILSNECDGMDVKYCFKFRDFKTESIVFGEDPFDRYSGDVIVFSYIFYEDVKIDELVYSYVSDYRYSEVAYLRVDKYSEMLEKYPDVTNEDFEVKFDDNDLNGEFAVGWNDVLISYKDYFIYQTWFLGEYVSGVSVENITSVLRSVVLVGE